MKKPLECCFNCKKKFDCSDAVSGKEDPCIRWEQWEIKEKKDPDSPTVA